MSKRILFLVGLAVLLALSGCSSQRKLLTNPQNPVAEAQSEGITLSLRFLEEQALRRQFGDEGNPFLTVYSGLQFQRIVVFELIAANANPVPATISLRDCNLYFGDRRIASASRMLLTGYWETVDKNRKTARGRAQIIDKYVLPDVTNVRPGGSARGYLVFKANMPSTGLARVSVGVKSRGSLIPFDLEFQF